jgi:hypothetical protein
MKKAKQKRWFVFEQEVSSLVTAFGYTAEKTQPSHDHGVDVVAFNNRRKVIIQCKLYGRGKIGGDTVMQLVGSRKFFDATDAICITTTGFTRQAVEIADKESVYLIDREKLLLLCRERNITIPSLTAMETTKGSILHSREDKVTIGREASNRWITEDASVSRHHAVLTRDKLHLFASDLGSTNGTSLNGKRVHQPVCLNYGDVLRVGHVPLTVVMHIRPEEDITT